MTWYSKKNELIKVSSRSNAQIHHFVSLDCNISLTIVNGCVRLCFCAKLKIL